MRASSISESNKNENQVILKLIQIESIIIIMKINYPWIDSNRINYNNNENQVILKSIQRESNIENQLFLNWFKENQL